jgi:hypothetical protein
MFVKPAEGIKVRDPISKLHLPETGAEKPDSMYWRRRLIAGDVVLVEEAKPEAAPAAQATARAGSTKSSASKE